MKTQVALLDGSSDKRRSGLSYDLPPHMLHRARTRLVGVILVFFTLNLVGLMVSLPGALRGVGAAEHGSVLHCMALALEAMTLWVIRSDRVRDEVALDAGLAFMVIASFVVSTVQPRLHWLAHRDIQDMTWAVPTLIVITIVVPAPPRRGLIAASLAGASLPLGLLIANGLGWVEVDTSSRFVAISITAAFSVALAYFSARVVHRIRTDAAAAERMGSYRLIEKLGEGGMGEVWRAEHQMLARPAAVKLIRPDDADPEHALMRFEREAQAIASLESPHTVSLFDFGIADDGRVYYVMELLRGEDLQTLVERDGAQPVAKVVRILEHAARSLAEAHTAGLIHRDVKPANIFLCDFAGERDVAKILDFGLVALRPDEPMPAPQLTAQGKVLGTPQYMAPEVVKNPNRVDARTDIYALGCVAYFLLAGRPVFTGTSAVEVLAEHLNTAPEPIERAAAADLPAPLERLVMSMLAKEPGDRPASAGVVLDRLRGIAAA